MNWHMPHDSCRKSIDECCVKFSDIPGDGKWAIRKEYAACVGVNTGCFNSEAAAEYNSHYLISDYRTEKSYFPGFWGKGVYHFAQFHKQYYGAYKTFVTSRGEKPLSLANFKTAFDSNLNTQLGLSKGVLPSGSRGYPELTLRAILPEDVRNSTPSPLTSQVIPMEVWYEPQPHCSNHYSGL